MPRFEIQTYEQWDFVVRYTVDAASPEVAVRMIAAGKVPITSFQHQEINPAQEVVRILGVTNHDTQEQINDEGKLNSLLGCSFN
jgi:hypothetical protein